ncbi:MAG: FtsX-like permease family protein [Pirellulaceae bacterium]
MSIWHLILREIFHRKLNFGLGLISVVIAVTCLTGAMTLLRAHDLETDRIVAEREAETAQRMKELEDDYRKMMLKMGFNVLILPQDQNLGDLYADDFASHYMPEEYATRLANSKIVTINHLLPSLQQKLKWPEQQRTIILIGTRGEVPLLHRDMKKPLLDAVPPGTVVVGHELAQSLKLSKGDKITLLGRDFTVTTTYEERGSKDDITLWIDLKEAQDLLGKTGQINAILALECECAGDRLAQIRREISAILPDTQVIEFASQALARAEARNRAADEAEAALLAEKHNRAEMRSRQESFASILVPLVVLGAAAWLATLGIANVRSRLAEIGILRAIGVRGSQIMLLFLQKAILLGLVGGAIGYLAGVMIGASLGDVVVAENGLWPWDPALLLMALLVAPVLSVVASWIPAILATRQDPALALRES